MIILKLCCQQSSSMALVCLTNRFNCLILCPIYHFHDVCIPLCFHQTHRSPLNIGTSEGVRVVNLKTWTVRRSLQEWEWCWPKTELTSSTSICIVVASWPVEPRIVPDSLLGPLYGRVKYEEKERYAHCSISHPGTYWWRALLVSQGRVDRDIGTPTHSCSV